MRKTRFKPARRQSGFTLLEMLAVIVLLGIVATIVVRQVGGLGNGVDQFGLVHSVQLLWRGFRGFNIETPDDDTPSNASEVLSSPNSDLR